MPISIHAPREGSDLEGDFAEMECHCISIHAPREGSDVSFHSQKQSKNVFLSTLPVRGATYDFNFAYTRVQFLSTLPVRGATDKHLS